MRAGMAPLQPLVTALPGTRTSCALLTVLTILLAWPNPPEWLAQLVRPAYFALLSWFFWRTTRASPELQLQPMRLVRGGFLTLLVSYSASAALPLFGPHADSSAFTYLQYVCERGALFLLGTTLIAFGLMMWIPQVIASHRLLEEHAARQRFALRDAESARSLLEQRLVEADRRGMLGELAATIAHDLRNPLTIVKGTAESLCRRPRTSAEVAEHTAVIQRNVEKADRTIEALIGLAKPRVGEPEDIASLATLLDVADLLHLEARRRGVALAVDRDAAAPALRTDRALLSQALLNLVLNAVQASPAGGTVRLRARRFARGEAGRVAFVIEDRGSGLPPEVRARLFTPFFTTKANGTGLGLSSCRRIATELRGSLRLYPRARGGTRALLLLPRAPGAAAPTPAAPVAACEVLA
jgi:signal transduction histidine kinase